MTQAERDIIIERCAAIVDQCNREGPYQAIAAAKRIRALKDEPHATGCMAMLLNETCTLNPDRCECCGFEPVRAPAMSVSAALECADCHLDYPASTKQTHCAGCGARLKSKTSAEASVAITGNHETHQGDA